VKLIENKDRASNAVNESKMMGVAPPKGAELSDNPLSEIENVDDSGEYEWFSQTHNHGKRPQSHATAHMYKTYRDKIYDNKSMLVISKPEVRVTSSTRNRFSRQPAWDSTLNCSYYGLLALRKRQEAGINCPH